MLKKIAFLLMVIILAQVSFADDHIQTLTHDGVERTFYLHLPANFDDSEALPLVIGLHTAASSGRAMAVLTGLDKAADEQGFIAVYPNSGELFGWNDGRQNAFSREVPFDDAGYIAALIDHMVENYNADPAKVYLVGWGGGGLLAYRMVCEMSAKFEAIAVVGVLMWDEHRQDCGSEPTESPKLLLLHGTDDWFYLPETYTYTSPFSPEVEGVDILGVEDTLNFWKERGAEVSFYNIEGASSANWPRLGEYELDHFGIDITNIITAFFNGDENWEVQQPELTETPRSYLVYLPSSYTGDEAMPLVMVLHGRPDTGAGIASITDMNLTAEKHGFIAVYPNGIRREWNYIKDLPIYPELGQDDFAFIRSLIADLSTDFNIDQERLYVTGFSNGGFMVNRLACEMPDQFAAFASVGGAAFTGLQNVCPPYASVNMLLMHGTNDVSIPWDGLTDSRLQGYAAFPVESTFGFWATQNGCPKETNIEDVPESGDSPGTTVKIVRVPACESGKELLLYAVLGGGHNWPGVPGRISERIAGEVNMDIHASEVIWEFFSRHTRDIE